MEGKGELVRGRVVSSTTSLLARDKSKTSPVLYGVFQRGEMKPLMEKRKELRKKGGIKVG